MKSIESIRNEAAEAGKRVRKEKAGVCFLLRDANDLEGMRIREIGTHEEWMDEHFRRLDTLFVDSSGFGRSGEGALTMEEFKAKLTQMVEEHGALYLGTTEMGQFQVHVGVWSALHPDGSLDTTPKRKTDEIVQKAIDKFISSFVKKWEKGQISPPDLGDCFYCQMKTIEGVPLGDAQGDMSHLISHLHLKAFKVPVTKLYIEMPVWEIVRLAC